MERRPSGGLHAADIAPRNLWNGRGSTHHQRMRYPDANARERPVCRRIAEAQLFGDLVPSARRQGMTHGLAGRLSRGTIRQADEMDRRGIICWQEWRDLRLEADATYLRAVGGQDYRPVNSTSSSAELGSNVISQ